MAKAAKVIKGLAASRRKRRSLRATSISRPRANPPIVADFTHVLLPGFGAYAATRVLQRIVFQLVGKKWPNLAKHAYALSGAAAFGGVWLVGHRIKALAQYHDALVMGSGIAAIGGIAQTYVPTKYNWLLSDCRPEDLTSTTGTQTTTSTGAGASNLQTAQGDDEYSYLEQQLEAMESSGSRRARTIAAPKASSKPKARAMQQAAANHGGGEAELDPDLLAELEPGEDVDDLYSGAFANN